MAVIRKSRSGKYILDFRQNGTRRWITFPTKREAEEARLELLGIGSSHTDAGEKVKAKLLKEAIKFYFETESVAKAARVNEGSYFDRLFLFLRGKGVSMVHHVTPLLMDEFKAERAATVYRTKKQEREKKPGRKLAASTVNREFNTYRHFFQKCVDWEAIPKNPCEKVKNLAVKKNPHRVWSDEEFVQIIARLPNWAADVLTAMYWTGAGPAELGRVTWSDVSFKRRTIHLKRYKGSGEEIPREAIMPKGSDFESLMVAKFETARREFKAKTSDFAFLNSKRNQIDARPLSTLVRRIVDALGLPAGTVPYGLRHKFGTELLEADVGEDKVRRLMGHKSVRTLIENYSHVKQDALREAMDVRVAQAENVKALRGTKKVGEDGC